MFEYILSALKDAVLAFDVDQQRCIYMNPAAEDILGYSCAGLSRMPNLWESLIDPRDKDNIVAAAGQLTAPSEQELTYRIVTPSLQTKWVQDKQLFFIQDGSCQRIRLHILKDITDVITYQEFAEQRIWFLNSLVNAQSTLAFRINSLGFYTYFNTSYAQILGYEVTELVGKPITYITVPEDVPLALNIFENCLAQPGKVFHFRHRKIAKNGSIHYIEFNCAAIINHEGSVREVQGVGMEMTEQVKAQKQAQDLLDKLNFYVDSITDLFFILDKYEKIIRVNKAFEKLTGRGRDEIIGKSIWQVFPLLRYTSFQQACIKALNDNSKETFTDYIKRRRMWFSGTVYPSHEGLTVIVRDITAEMQAGKEAAWTKYNLEALINNTHDLIWSVDKDKKYVFANSAYRKWVNENSIAQHKQEAVIDASQTAYPDEHTEEWDSYYDKALNGQRFSVKRQYTHPQKDALLYFEIFFNPIFDEHNEVTGAGCFARNITKRLKVGKALLQQNQRLRSIASISSHELRRPVATLMGLVSVLDMQNLSNPANHEVLSHIHEVSHELDDVIRQIVNKTFMSDEAEEAE